MARKPLIGITPRFNKGHRDEYGNDISDDELMAKVFTDSILAAGGLPVCLPLTDDEQLQGQMVAELDGLAVPGGPDVDPALWGVSGYDEKLLCHERDAFEFPMIKRFIEADKPVFTTCRGTQLLNVVLGGTLNMDVPGWPYPEGAEHIDHLMHLSNLAHFADVEPDTLLAKALGCSGRIEINSAHHCCVDKLGDGLVLSAHATDGVPECIEMPGKKFVLGVQWHPEYTWSFCDYDFNLWKSFIKACQE